MVAVIPLTAPSSSLRAEPVARFLGQAPAAPAGQQPEVPPPARPPLRLIPGGRDAALRHRRPAHVYRRRRLVAGLALLTAAVLATVLTTAVLTTAVLTTAVHTTAVAPDGGPGTPASAAAPPAVAPAAVHVVRPGDTYWSIATELRPGADPRPLVDELVRRNGGAVLQVGQRLDLTGLGG